MTDAELTLIASRIMDRAERDKALHLSSIVEEIRAGIANLEAKRRTPDRSWTIGQALYLSGENGRPAKYSWDGFGWSKT